MPSKKGGGKSKKGKKPKAKLRKFDLDLFGILTFTRYHGIPFQEYMFSSDKKKGAKVAKDVGGKGKKKKKKAVAVPKLGHFPPVPEDISKDMKTMRMKKKIKDQPDVIIPTTSIGFKEKTTRPPRPFTEGGSISDVMCGKKYPLPPRPQPHGGVYGDLKCIMCKTTGNLLSTPFGGLHKKMRKLLTTEFEKAKYIIQWLTERITDTMKKYEDHMKNILDEMGPELDALDESEWDDHFEVREMVEKWRDLQKELDALRAELKQFRKNREEEIAKAVAEKLKELEDIERQMLALEKKIQEAMESLKDWQQNAESKISKPEADIAAVLERLRMIRESIYVERDTLRQLLGWEMSVATENTIAIMEEIIKKDLDILLGWMHPAWFRLFLENRKMQEERSRLRMGNHLLELEVETLARQVEQMEANQKEVESTRTYFITPPTLNDRVDKFTRYYDDFAIVQLPDYPNTRFIHE